MQRDRLPYLLISLAALIATLPLILYGCSCGHDFDFHLLSWLEAAHQFTHGNLHPHWAYTPAYNAGEPRFVFYPPLSWTLGGLLGLILPWTWTPIVYTWLALTASGLALHRLARDFTTPTAAILAAILYTVNPYMLFTAYERTAYAELLAAAWIPLLLHAILRKQVTIPRIAIPIALLWITNAPAAVMSCYALAILALIRLLHTPPPPDPTPHPNTNPNPTTETGAPSSARTLRLRWASRTSATALTTTQSPLKIALNTAAGAILGLGLASFYILPAAYERRFVQIAMAVIPNMRIQDNFLFHHTGDIDHDQVLHTASLIAITLIAATFITLITLYLTKTLHLTKKAGVPHPSQPHREGWDATPSTSQPLLLPLTILTAAITLLLTPITTIIWNHAPELAFLQFPWRLLAILAAVLALAIALALSSLNLKPLTTTTLTLLLTASLTYPAYTTFHQTCDPEDTVQTRESLFHSNQGSDPTDEYTPTTADNDSLAHADPAYWLSPNPDAKAPANTPSAPAPTHLTINAPIAEDLILNLRDFPAWHITRNGAPITNREQRDDGLIALPIPAGPSTIDLTYAHTLDQTIGNTITLISLLLLIAMRRKDHVLPDGPTPRGEVTS
ncbi:hypothetical protein [Granulicella sp. L60]|uniref:hypothetical protein n=1 Tax=Granulicella sp. L60 TaxID=1641866 RepID=UPI00131CF5CF|nr:hypothetical protein [Granulicella sp. L60]